MKEKIKWTKFKDMPKGMKFILVLTWITVLSELIDIFKNTNKDNSIFGFQAHPPISSIFILLVFTIAILTLIGIYIKKWRKFILITKGFLLVSFIPNAIIMITMPAKEMISLGGDISKFSSETITKLATMTKLLALGMLSIGFIVGIIIWIYIFRSKKYFSDDSQEINIEPNITNITN